MKEEILYFNTEEFKGYEEIDLKGEKNYYVEGYASTIDEDLSGEIIANSAQEDLERQIKERNITLDLEHEEWYDEKGEVLAKPKNSKIPVARVVEVKRTLKGTWIKAVLNKNLKSFGEVWNSIRDGFLKAFSIAYYPVIKSGNKVMGLNLVNITLTGSPVNPNATFCASLKSASGMLNVLEEKKMEEVKKEEVKLPVCKGCNKESELKNDVCKDCEVVEKEAFLKSLKEEVKKDFDVVLKGFEEKQKEFENKLLAKDVEIAELKAKLEAPVMKAMVEKETTKIEKTPFGVLNLIK